MSTGNATALRWGLVGLGKHAERYIAPALTAARGSSLVAVASASAERAGQFAARFGVPRAHGGLKEMLSAGGLDAVAVCSANDQHYEQVIAAAEAGVHVLCEKPLAATTGQAAAMVARFAEAGLVLGVGLHLRHNPLHQLARQWVAEGRIGRPVFGEVRYIHVSAGQPASPRPAWRTDPRLGGGRLVGTGIHAIDLARFVSGQEVAEVAGTVLAQEEPPGERLLVGLELRLTGSLPFSVTAGRVPFADNRAVITGEDGMIVLRDSIGNFGGGTATLSSASGSAGQVRAGQVHYEVCDPYVAEAEDFAQAVATGRAPLGDGRSGVALCAVAEAAERSFDERRWQQVAV